MSDDTRAAAKRLAKKLGLLKATEDTIEYYPDDLVHIERAILQARAPLRWTREKPDKPGWYWYREYGETWIEELIQDATGQILRLYDGQREALTVQWAGEWAGPIEPPSEYNQKEDR